MAIVSMVEQVTYRVLDGEVTVGADAWLEASLVTFLRAFSAPVEVCVPVEAYHALQMGSLVQVESFLAERRARLRPVKQDSDLLLLTAAGASLRVPRPPLVFLSAEESTRLVLLLAYQALRCEPFRLSPVRAAKVALEVGVDAEDLFARVLRGERPGLVDVQAVLLQSGMGWHDALEAARLVSR